MLVKVAVLPSGVVTIILNRPSSAPYQASTGSPARHRYPPSGTITALDSAATRARCSGGSSDPQRVARCVAGLFNPILYPGMDARVEVSQEEIGHLAGISRQRVNQALHRLEKEGLVKVDYGRIRILDLEGLRNFTC